MNQFKLLFCAVQFHLKFKKKNRKHKLKHKKKTGFELNISVIIIKRGLIKVTEWVKTEYQIFWAHDMTFETWTSFSKISKQCLVNISLTRETV